MFVDALAAMGQPAPIVLSHADVLDDPRVLERVAEPDLLIRIESVGEREDVTRRLLRLGHEDAVRAGVATVAPRDLDDPIPHGRIVAPRQAHLGFERYLDRLEAVLATRPGWTPLSPFDAIRALFDKRVTSARYRALGLPTPERLDADDPEALRGGMRARGWDRAYVKVSCSSSASGLAVLSRGTPDRLMTTVELDGDAMYNSLRVQRVEDPERVERILGFLLREGAQVERAEPKARLDGPGHTGRAFMDCRFLVVAGEPAFTVVRLSRHPITNLHLGGFRGDLDALRARVPADVLEAAHESCRVIAREHGCLHVGVDILFTPRFDGHRVIEANAFGDLLPGLTLAGRNVYEHEIAETPRWLADRRRDAR
ncbi:MAG: STM4014 family protein [Myxococcales bacterium]|nr:STM4014 family protein [Myxococcales bacterium]